jgi:hypothetical protein
MTYYIKDFTAEDIPSAVAFFLDSYRREQESTPLLPKKIIEDPQLLYQTLESQVTNPGAAIFSKDTLIAYMLTGATFTF